MRSREILEVIIESLSLLERVRTANVSLQASTKDTGPTRPVSFLGGADAKRALQALLDLDLGKGLERLLLSALSEPVLSAFDDTPLITSEAADRVIGRIREVSSALRLIRDAMNKAAPVIDSEVLLIKLPPSESLADTAEVLSNLSTAFDVPLGHLREPPLRLEGVDSGSIFLLLSPQSAAALGAIGGLVFALSRLASVLTQHRESMAMLDAFKVDGEIRKKTADIQVDAMRQVLTALATEVAAGAQGGQPKPEFISVCVNSLRLLQEIVDKGGEVRLLAASKLRGGQSEIAALGSPPAPPQLPSGS